MSGKGWGFEDFKTKKRRLTKEKQNQNQLIHRHTHLLFFLYFLPSFFYSFAAGAAAKVGPSFFFSFLSGAT